MLQRWSTKRWCLALLPPPDPAASTRPLASSLRTPSPSLNSSTETSSSESQIIRCFFSSFVCCLYFILFVFFLFLRWQRLCCRAVVAVVISHFPEITSGRGRPVAATPPRRKGNFSSSLLPGGGTSLFSASTLEASKPSKDHAAFVRVIISKTS